MRWPALSPPRSLQRRLGLGLAAGVTLLWLAGAVTAGLILRHEIAEVFDSSLQEVVQRILPLAYVEILSNETAPSGPVRQMPSVEPHREHITYIVRDGAGRLLLQSHDADARAFPAGLESGFRDFDGRRLYTEGAVQGTIFVTALEQPGHRQEAVSEAFTTLLWPLIALLPLSQIGIWLLVRSVLKPVLGFQEEIEARGRGDLSPVPTAMLPGELTPVAEAVNRLIARLKRAMEAERSFTASSAHELRTPIAAALAQTQRLIAETPEGPARVRAASVEAALHRLVGLSGKLLQLAKAEGGGLLAETPQDIVRVLQIVVEDFRREAEGAARVELHVPMQGGLLTRMDPDAFAILARNLIENGLRHGDADRPVRVVLTEEGLLRVTNGGATVPAEDMERLKRPFERGSTLAGGSGLGLAIAEAITTGAGAKLELFSPEPGRTDGFEARFRLPDSAELESLNRF